MKILIISIFSILLFSAFGQKTDIITTDSTGNAYVIFLKNDSTAVVFRGKNTAFTTDQIFAQNFTAFDLKFEGFSRFRLKRNESEIHKTNCTDTIIAIIPIDPPTSQETIAFPVDVNYQNPNYWIEAYTWSSVPAKKSTIKGMNGYDFAPIVANKTGDYQYGSWNQEYISIGQKDIWVENNVKYFLRPKGYKTDTKSNLWDFDLKFPDFKPPNGRIVVMQPTPKREIGVFNYLKKGVSYVKDKGDSQGYIFVSDGWLIDLGCPPAYGVEQSIFDKWCNDVDADRLLQSFVQNVYYPNRDKGYVMLNWEHVGHRWNVRKDKIIQCLEYWATHEHTAKMALWTVSGVSMGKPVFQGLGIDFSDALRFEGTIDEFRQKFGNYITTDDSYSKYVEISQVGGYMNYPIDDGVIQHYVFEALLNKKFYPGKSVLATVWFDQELINNFGLGRIKVESVDGTYFAQVKPKVFPSVAFNWGVWSMVFDGIDCWSDPNYWTDDKRFWGWGAIDVNGKDLPNKHDEVGAKFPAQSMKAIDWIMSGVWVMSENKDIIEAKGEFEFVTLPTKSYFDKSVLIAYKKKGNELLVLAFDGFCDADAVKEHSFFIGSKEFKIKTYGRYTSVARLKL